MKERPKPCPFCGCDATMCENYDYPPRPVAWCVNSECPINGIALPLDMWNTRPGESALRAEVIKWVEAGNAGTKLINEQRATIQAQGERIVQLDNIIRAAHATFTQGGTDPADDDVISLLMAKILEEALL